MEKYLERYLKKHEVVHHINKNKQDNKLSNLQLFSNNNKHLNYHKYQLNKKGDKHES
jgi:hypothetical protein